MRRATVGVSVISAVAVGCLVCCTPLAPPLPISPLGLPTPRRSASGRREGDPDSRRRERLGLPSRPGQPSEQANIIGYDVEAADGSIGKIDKASKDTSRQYLLVDTGSWIFGKKRLIPAGMATRVDRTNRKVYVSMTKDQIKQAPDYDEAMTTDGDAYYDKYSSYYGPYWS